MRTPGADEDLAAGFLFTEGIVQEISDIAAMRGGENVITVSLDATLAVDLQKLERHFYTTSSCGVCGKTSIDAVKTAANCSFTGGNEPIPIRPEIIYARPIPCAASRRRSTRRAVCTRPCSTRKAGCWPFARTWAGTTPSTNSSATTSGRAPCPRRPYPAAERPRQFRVAAKSRDGGYTVRLRGRRAVQSGGRNGGIVRHHARRFFARQPVQRLFRRDNGVMIRTTRHFPRKDAKNRHAKTQRMNTQRRKE